MKKVSNLKNDIFDRVVLILEEARNNVVRAVNSNMVIAYWLIGREIVEEIQGGEDRAEYGKKVVEELSEKLTKKYKKGFSTTNLWYFKQFSPILHNRSGESETPQFSQRLSWSHYRVLMRVAKKRAA